MKIDQRRWNRTLKPMLERLQGDLGIPAGCHFKAQFHAMLVYTRGQFFVPHQDSEKNDGMIATLIVTLPSTVTGGSLIVGQGPRQATYRTPRSRLSMAAFYADCRHEVRPVRSGHRIVLTYNLVLTGDTQAATHAPTEEVQTELAGQLRAHFAQAPPPPERLVYLLDHDYTERALDWSRLKGVDANRVAALLGAAAREDCMCALALTEVHETRDAYEPEWGRPRRWGHHDDWGDQGDGEYDETAGNSYEEGDLLDSEITLGHWLVDEPGARTTAISSVVTSDEVCTSLASDQLTPYASEYEGYMGNYGNTMDRWYRRAALVVWQQRDDFAVRAQMFPRSALDTLAGHVKAGRKDDARRLAADLDPFWDEVITPGPWRPGPSRTPAQQRALFTRALAVGAQLDTTAAWRRCCSARCVSNRRCPAMRRRWSVSGSGMGRTG